MSMIDVGEGVFEGWEDPRAPNARLHSRHDILVIAFCTMLSGGETCTDMELFGHAKRELLVPFLSLDHRVPSHDTFSRTLGLLDPVAFEQWFVGFMASFTADGEGLIAVDGKTLRRFAPCIASARLRSRWLNRVLSCGAIGGSRTDCIGCWT